MAYLYVLLTVIFTVYGQLILKWRVNIKQVSSNISENKIYFLIQMLYDIYVISGFIAAFAASLTWMMAMRKLQLTYVYPLTVALTFSFITIFSILFLNENLTLFKIIGLALIFMGIYTISTGK